MKLKFYAVLCLSFLYTLANAQCPVGTAYYWNTANPVTMNVPSTVANTWKQNIIYVNVVAGNTYEVGNCTNVNGTNPAAAGGTSVTVRASGGGAVIASASGPGAVCASFVAPVTGQVWAYFYTDACTNGTSFFTSGAVWTAPACAVPTGVTATGVTTSSANISWTAAAGATGYEYAVNTSSTPPASGTGTTTATSYNPTGLTPSTNYYFHVRTNCSSTSSSNWVSIPFTTQALCVAPATPTISNIQQFSATATWPAVSGSLGYEWAVTTSSTPPTTGLSTTTNTTQNLTGLSTGTQYYFHVRNLCASSLVSTWTTVSFTTAYPACIAPSTPTVSNINVNGATINWNAVAGSSGYEWVVTTSPTPPPSGTATTNTTVNAGGLTGGTLYYVYVRNNCGPGGFSPWASTTFTTGSSCNVPTNIIVTNIGYTSADIQWDPIPGIQGFEYIVDNTPQAPTTAGAAIAFNQYSPNNLVSATRYFAHIRTNCGGGAGFSPWVTVQFTTDTVCKAPVAVINNITGTTADINWAAEANALNYQYYVSTNITPPFSGYATTALNYMAKGLNKNTQYYMHLRSYCGGNDISAWRSTGFVTNEETTGIKTSGDDLGIEVYPNPVTETLILKITGIQPIQGMISVIDITGKVMMTQEVTEEKTEINMGQLVNGIYMLKYTDQQHIETIRIVKQ